MRGGRGKGVRGVPQEGLGCSGVKGQRGTTVGVDIILSNGVHHTVLSKGQL